MFSIFETYSALNKNSLWESAELLNIPSNSASSEFLYLPELPGKQEFILMDQNLVHKEGNFPKKINLEWKTFEPFVEAFGSKERFGFRISSGEIYQDFYTENSESLEKWIATLRNICIQKNINDEFEFGKLLGRGHSASVNLGVCDSNNYAIKSISKEKYLNTLEAVERLCKEIQTMRALKRKTIVKLYGVYECQEYIHLILDYLPYQNALEMIKGLKGIPEASAAKIMKQLLDALIYIHSRKFIHRDVKLENIMVSSDFKKVKLLDFGLACKSSSKGQTLQCGSPGYVAPEILKGQVYDFKVDVFSAGIVMYSLLSGLMPFAGVSVDEILKNNKAGLVSFNNSTKNISSEAKELIREMTRPDPADRLSAYEAMIHPWIVNNNL